MIFIIVNTVIIIIVIIIIFIIISIIYILCSARIVQSCEHLSTMGRDYRRVFSSRVRYVLVRISLPVSVLVIKQI